MQKLNIPESQLLTVGEVECSLSSGLLIELTPNCWRVRCVPPCSIKHERPSAAENGAVICLLTPTNDSAVPEAAVWRQSKKNTRKQAAGGQRLQAKRSETNV